MGCSKTRDALYAAFERYYAVARASLAAVWPAVVAVAQKLLEKTDLDRPGFLAAIQGHDIYAAVSRVQAAHGIL